MLHVSHQLCGAGRVDAVPRHLALEVLHRLTASGTLLRRPVGLFRAAPDLGHGTDHVRDHLPGALDQHPVADADVLLGDVVEIVQGGVLDDDAADFDRFERGARCQHTRPPDLDLDAEQFRRHLPCRELEGDGPARVFAHEAEFRGEAQVVNLDDHAVGLVGQFVAAVGPGFRVGDGSLEVREAAGRVRDREAERFQPFQQFPLAGRDFAAFRINNLVDEQRQWAGGGDGRVELAQRPGGGVARVEIDSLTGFRQFLV